MKHLVRAYLSGTASWDDVHHFALDLEERSVPDFPGPLGDLRMMFLTADSRDHSQFIADKVEIEKLITHLEPGADSTY